MRSSAPATRRAATGGSTERGRTEAVRAAWLIGGSALFLLLFYLLLYPVHGFRLALGSDTPVYVWWSRRTGDVGMRSLLAGSRPGIDAVLASLEGVIRVRVGWLVAPMAPVLAIALSLATAAFVDSCLGRDRTRFVLVALFTGAFLSLMVPGYLSTLAFGSAVVAALACQVAGIPLEPGPAASWVPFVASGGLVGAAGLAHPLFLGLGGVLVAGGLVGLVPAVRRDLAAGVPLIRTPAFRIAIGSAAGLGVTGAGLLYLGHAAKASVDTSRDSVLRRVGLGKLSQQSYVRVIIRFFPWYRIATVLAFLALPFVPLPRRIRSGPSGRAGASDRARFFWGSMLAWLAITVGCIVALLAGTSAPGQRMAAFCLALPVLGAIGVVRFGRPMVRTARRRRAALAAPAVAAILFLSVGWMFWSRQQPLLIASTAAELRAAGAALQAEPPGTPLILVNDDRVLRPAFDWPRTMNYLRDSVAAERVPDVHLYVGTPQGLLSGRVALTGIAEHDRVARAYWREVQSLLHRTPPPLAIVLENADPESFAAAFRLPDLQQDPAAYQIAPGVLALPGLTGGVPVPVLAAQSHEGVPHGSGTSLMSSWLPLWTGALILLILTGLGWSWARAALPDSADELTRLALAPAFGLAALGLASFVPDAAGIRLSGAGGLVAAGIALAGGILAMRARRGAFRRMLHSARS